MLTTDFAEALSKRMQASEVALTAQLIKSGPDRHDVLRGMILQTQEVRLEIDKALKATILNEEMPFDA
jgi:hypothetical protein